MELDLFIEGQVKMNGEWRSLVSQADSSKTGGGSCDTIREILQQPWVWRASARRVVESGVLGEPPVRKAESIWLSGAGSSVLVGHSVGLSLQKRTGKPCRVVPTTDLVLAADSHFPANAQGLMVSFSRSGASAESFEAVEAVRRVAPGVQHLLVTCNPDGRLISQFAGSDDFSYIALHPATCDKGLAMTSSFSSMVLAAQALAFSEDSEAYLLIADNLASLAEVVLEQSAGICAWMLRDGGPQRICFLGSGVREGVGREAALKVLEMTDGALPTLAESYLGVRHGPMSFLNDRTAIIFFVSSDPRTRAYELDLISEVQQKGLGHSRVALGYDLEPVRRLVDRCIELPGAEPRVPDDLMPPVDILLPQVLALSLSLARGLDPDNPSPRGVINRVAQGVKLH